MVLTNSEALKAQICLNAQLAPELVSVIYNGVEESFRQVFRAKDLSCASSALYIGRLHPSKGILRLVKAFVKRPSLDMHFHIIGEGSDLREVKSLAQRDRRLIVRRNLNAAEIQLVMV